mmetsp:Transcript_102511/g.330659  ORF Transcript_102511/g.330659 Transcript_102511/m.330659 type:complete len:439 (+) Transcript_102511:461-1777(+)
MTSLQSALIRYPDDAHPLLWQERVLLVKIGGTAWFAASPDGDIERLYLADYECRFMVAGRRLPFGVKEKDCYLVYKARRADKFFDAGELARMQEEAEVRLSLEDQPLPTVGGGASGSGAAGALPVSSGPRRIRGKTPPRSGPRLPVAALMNVGDDEVASNTTPLSAASDWYAVEKASGVAPGDRVPSPAASLRRGHRGLSECVPSQFVCARRMTDADLKEFMMHFKLGGGHSSLTSATLSSDARTLPVLSTAVGRHREFSSLAELCEEELFDDFPLTGPRTAHWCLNFLRRRHTPTDHHMSFRTMARLGSDAWGMGEHEQLLKMVELAGSFDQLDLSNLAWAEMAFRRIQVIEWVHHERVREGEASGDRLSPEEWAAFSGTTKAGDTLMVCPQLLSHMKGVVETDVQIMKSVRKAREERELKRGHAKAKGKGKASADG